MGTIIKNVQLQNWYNYKGEYSDNIVKFSKGINFFVSDNDNGKSKLHNALRWILHDNIILYKKVVPINEDNINIVTP